MVKHMMRVSEKSSLLSSCGVPYHTVKGVQFLLSINCHVERSRNTQFIGLFGYFHIRIRFYKIVPNLSLVAVRSIMHWRTCHSQFHFLKD